MCAWAREKEKNYCRWNQYRCNVAPIEKRNVYIRSMDRFEWFIAYGLLSLLLFFISNSFFFLSTAMATDLIKWLAYASTSMSSSSWIVFHFLIDWSSFVRALHHRMFFVICFRGSNARTHARTHSLTHSSKKKKTRVSCPIVQYWFQFLGATTSVVVVYLLEINKYI